jgi:hypothetical protein
MIWLSQCLPRTRLVLNKINFWRHYCGILLPINYILRAHAWTLFAGHTVSSIGRVTAKKFRPVSATSDVVTNCRNRDTCNNDRSCSTLLWPAGYVTVLGSWMLSLYVVPPAAVAVAMLHVSETTLTSARPHVSSLESLDGFWWNLVSTLCHWRYPNVLNFLFPAAGNKNSIRATA